MLIIELLTTDVPFVIYCRLLSKIKFIVVNSRNEYKIFIHLFFLHTPHPFSIIPVILQTYKKKLRIMEKFLDKHIQFFYDLMIAFIN